MELQQVDDPRFHELRFRQRRRDSQDWLVGKEGGPLGHGVHVAREAEARQRVDEIGAKSAAISQPAQFFLGEAQVLEILEHLFQTCGDQKTPLGRQVAHVHLERRGFVQAVNVVGLEHRQLVKVGQQRAREKLHVMLDVLTGGIPWGRRLHRALLGRPRPELS